jgi:hypothetical protein
MTYFMQPKPSHTSAPKLPMPPSTNESVQLKVSLSSVLYRRLQERSRDSGVPTAAYVRYLILKDLEVTSKSETESADDDIPDSSIEQHLKQDPHYYLGENRQLGYTTKSK